MPQGMSKRSLYKVSLSHLKPKIVSLNSVSKQEKFLHGSTICWAVNWYNMKNNSNLPSHWYLTTNHASTHPSSYLISLIFFSSTIYLLPNASCLYHIVLMCSQISNSSVEYGKLSKGKRENKILSRQYIIIVIIMAALQRARCLPLW